MNNVMRALLLVGGMIFGQAVQAGLVYELPEEKVFDGTNALDLSQDINAKLNTAGKVSIAALVKFSPIEKELNGLWQFVLTGNGHWNSTLSIANRFENIVINAGVMQAGNAPMKPDNQWHFVVATYDGKAPTMYVNGKAIKTKDVDTAKAVNYNKTIQIGKDMRGSVKMLKIYDSILTEDEAKKLYSQTKIPDTNQQKSTDK